MSRILAAGLFAALAILETGCGCCHKQTVRPTAPACCPPSGGLPPGAIPAPPPGVSNFPPPGLAATYPR